MTKTQSNPLTIGVLGGMGPEATADLFSKIIKATPAEKDQDHLRVIIDSNPGVPDRTAAILGGGESPVPAMAAGCTALSRAGADFIVIPCVSAHMFLDELRALSPLPVHSLFDAVTAKIAQARPRIRTAGLIATTGTVQGGRFQAHLKAARIETIVPEDHVQKQVMDAIYDIKNTKTAASRNEIGRRLAASAETLLADSGTVEQSVIIPPCDIGENAVIRNSIVGPHVSLGSNSTVEHSVVSNTVVQNNTQVRHANLRDSMIGNEAAYEGQPAEVSIGDYSEHK